MHTEPGYFTCGLWYRQLVVFSQCAQAQKLCILQNTKEDIWPFVYTHTSNKKNKIPCLKLCGIVWNPLHHCLLFIGRLGYEQNNIIILCDICILYLLISLIISNVCVFVYCLSFFITYYLQMQDLLT